MSYLKLLKNGYKITIYDTNGRYTPTTFSWDNNCIYYNNEHLGYAPHINFNDDKKRFSKHIEKMLADNLSIKIEI